MGLHDTHLTWVLDTAPFMIALPVMRPLALILPFNIISSIFDISSFSSADGTKNTGRDIREQLILFF